MKLASFAAMLPAFALALCAAAPAQAGPVDNLAPGEWYEVPSSHMVGKDPCPARNCSYSAVEGQGAVMDDWSGGAFDTLRDRLLVWGGGHGGYGGNELYAFDLDTLTWLRLTDPSDPPGVDTPYAPDGAPISRHTYDYVQYVPAIDAFCSFGGAAFYVSGQTGTAHTDCYSFKSNHWVKKHDSLFHGLGAITACDPLTGYVWGKGTGYSPSYDAATRLGAWDSSADAFWAVDSGNSDLAYKYALTAAVDPKRHLFVAIGGGDAWVWDISDPHKATRSALGASGATGIESSSSPGLVYDSASDELVAWNGGASVYTLDLDKRVWTRVDPAATNAVTPTTANGRGTFGRFRYSAQKNVFVVVNSTKEDVYIYRLTSGTGSGGTGGGGAGGTGTGGTGTGGTAAAGGTPANGSGGSGNPGGAASNAAAGDSTGCSCSLAGAEHPWRCGRAAGAARPGAVAPAQALTPSLRARGLRQPQDFL